MSKNKYYIPHDGKFFTIDIQKIVEYCLTSEDKQVRDTEITEGYEKTSEEEDSLVLTSKVIRENMGVANPQNDMIAYDVIKMFLSIILGQTDDDNPFENISFSIAFNTLVSMGFLYEVNE